MQALAEALRRAAPCLPDHFCESLSLRGLQHSSTSDVTLSSVGKAVMQLAGRPSRPYCPCHGCKLKALPLCWTVRRQAVRACACADDGLTRRALLQSACLLPLLGTSSSARADEPEAEIKLPMPGSNPYGMLAPAAFRLWCLAQLDFRAQY